MHTHMHAHTVTPRLPSAQHLLSWRTPHKLGRAPKVATLHATPNGGAVLTVVDAHNGKRIERTELAYSVDKVRHSVCSLG